jgi:hypothetical protein
MPQQEIKKFFDNGIDADSAEHLVPPNSFISGQNVRIGGSTDLGGVGYIESILENTEKFHTVASTGTNTTIGFAADDENGWIAKFNHNDAGWHGIFLYVIESDTWYTMLLDQDVTDGLNFEVNELIHSARIENGCLYWVNGLINEPRRIDIRAAVNLYTPGTFSGVDAYTSPIAQSVIRWIRRQPGLPLSGTKSEASAYINNFIKDDGFWFSYRYIYRNYEVSTLSAWSLLFNYNQADETYNYINLEVPFEETIEQDVLQVDLVVKYASSGKSFIVKSWNREVAADEADIDAHNAGSTELYYDFANDITGIALDDAYAVKPYDSLPIYAQTIEIARNRAFMLNYTLGYDTPLTSSLVAGAQIEDDATLTGQWILIEYNSGASQHYFLDLGSLGYYDATIQPSPPPYPSTYAYGNMTLVAIGPANFALYILANYTFWINGIQSVGEYAEITGGPPVPGISGDTVFKSGATYLTSVSFFDHSGRKCGITTPPVKVNIPERDYGTVSYATGINWSLSNVSATTEIPDWAYYYSVNITKCLTTRFFLTARAKNITYATKDADGEYVFNTTGFDITNNGVAVDFTLLNGYGMGYTFTEGDLIKVYIDGDPLYTLAIIGQEGVWLICELQNLGTLGNLATPKTDVLFEIFTPYKPSTSEPHYEVAQIYTITDPTTVSRVYSEVAGTILGDVTLLTREDGAADEYLTENMSPSDKFYTRWNTYAGRPNFVDTIGQQVKTNDIAYSDRLIAGTKTNGLSTFEALNTKDIPLECGDGTKLQVADKISEQGNIMLAICANETVSLYLSEAQLLGSSGNAFLAQSSDVIGTVNVLQGSFGSLNPESVVVLRGRVFFYSLIKGCFVAYSNNGLFPVSNYGLRRVAHLFSQAYAALSQSEIEDLGSRPFVFGGVDPYHLEVYWSIPATTATPPKGYLEDYVSPDEPVIYPYDIYDGTAKVLVFKPNQDRWAAPHSYETEYFIDIRDFLFSAKNGSMYQHNYDNGTDETYGKWYGTEVTSDIGFIVNEEPNIVKQFVTLSVEGNMQPSWTHQRCELPFVQSADLVDEWIDREGVLYSQINRDRLSPNVTGTFDEKAYTGDVMRGQWLKVYARFTTRELLQIRFFNVGFSPSLGHKT